MNIQRGRTATVRKSAGGFTDGSPTSSGHLKQAISCSHPSVRKGPGISGSIHISPLGSKMQLIALTHDGEAETLVGGDVAYTSGDLGGASFDLCD